MSVKSRRNDGKRESSTLDDFDMGSVHWILDVGVGHYSPKGQKYRKKVKKEHIERRRKIRGKLLVED